MTGERISNELLYEVLKSIQAQVSTVREDVDLIKMRTSTIERKLGDIQSDIGGHSERIDRVDLQLRQFQSRMDRIEAFTTGENIQ